MLQFLFSHYSGKYIGLYNVTYNICESICSHWIVEVGHKMILGKYSGETTDGKTLWRRHNKD